MDIISSRNLKDEGESESRESDSERCLGGSDMEEDDDTVIEVLLVQKREDVCIDDVIGDQILGEKEKAMFDRDVMGQNVQNVTPIVVSMGIINEKVIYDTIIGEEIFNAERVSDKDNMLEVHEGTCIKMEEFQEKFEEDPKYSLDL